MKVSILVLFLYSMKKLIVFHLLLFCFGFNYIFGLESKEKINVTIIPSGNIRNTDIMFVQKTLRNFYNADVVVSHTKSNFKFCKIKNSNKYDAGCILSSHDHLKIPKNGKILILTDRNISTNRNLNGVTHKNWSIFGLGRINGKSCVVSTYKIKARSTLAKVSIHEIGHTLGLNHCDDNLCVMTDAKGRGSRIYKNSGKLCTKCIKNLNHNYITPFFDL